MLAKHWLQSGLLALAAAALPAAHAVNNVPMVMQDTITDLKIDLVWDGGGTTYLGQHWNVWFSEILDANTQTWDVAVSYQHKDGPHGELAEGGVHTVLLATLTADGFILTRGIDDHLLPSLHPMAHYWNLGVWGDGVTAQGQATGGFAAFQVAHVPEPGTWLMLAGGLAVLALRAKRRS